MATSRSGPGVNDRDARIRHVPGARRGLPHTTRVPAAQSAVAAGAATVERTVRATSARTPRPYFFTSAKNFVTDAGVRVGTTTARAERRLHRRLISGCEENFYLGSGTVSLTVADSGGHAVKPDRHVVGGHVSALVLHSRRHDVGFFDCL